MIDSRLFQLPFSPNMCKHDVYRTFCKYIPIWIPANLELLIIYWSLTTSFRRHSIYVFNLKIF